MLDEIWIAFLICCTVAISLTVIGIYFSRKKRNKMELESPGPVRIIQEIAENSDNCAESVSAVASHTRYHEPDLNRAISMAVYRAILKGDAEVELTVKLPEKCSLFGNEVEADGVVRIRTEVEKGLSDSIQIDEEGEAPLF